MIDNLCSTSTSGEAYMVSLATSDPVPREEPDGICEDCIHVDHETSSCAMGDGLVRVSRRKCYGHDNGQV